MRSLLLYNSLNSLLSTGPDQDATKSGTIPDYRNDKVLVTLVLEFLRLLGVTESRKGYDRESDYAPKRRIQ